jgi:hypothetical protein
MGSIGMLPSHSGQPVDGIFVHAGQAGGLPYAVLLEKVMENVYGLVLRKLAPRKHCPFSFREVRAASRTIQHPNGLFMPRPAALRKISSTLFAEFRTFFILAAERLNWTHGFTP